MDKKAAAHMKQMRANNSRLRSPPAFQIYAEAQEFLTNSPRDHNPSNYDGERLAPLDSIVNTNGSNGMGNIGEGAFPPRPTLALGKMETERPCLLSKT